MDKSGCAFAARSILFRFACAVALILGSAPSVTSAAAQREDPGDDIVARQLVILFDPMRDDSPSTATVIDAVRNPEAHPELYEALGRPADPAKLIADSPIELQDELAKTPWSPRARLEQYVVLTYPTVRDRQGAEDMLKKNELVVAVDRNLRYTLSAVPNDRYFALDPGQPGAGNYQWGMQVLNMPQAWDKVRGSAYIASVADGIVCPGGIPCITHPDLVQNLRQHFSRAFVEGIPAPSNHQIDEQAILDAGIYYKGHGTHVAGIMAATPQYGPFDNQNSNTGVAGACWTCSLAVLKSDRTATATAAAIAYGADHGIQAMNMSFGDDYSTPQFASCTDAGWSYFCDAFLHALQRDVVLVGASGNRYQNRIQFPARSPEVIAVGGIKFGGSFWTPGYGFYPPCTAGVAGDECGSNYGPEQAVVAPAMDIVSTMYPGYDWVNEVHCGDHWGPDSGVGDGYGDCTGTSMAAPHVTGLVGLLRTINPLSTRDQVKSVLTGSTTPCVGSYSGHCGAGIPNAGQQAQVMLGSASAVNRLTPLFGFYGSSVNEGFYDHFYTVVPQMGLAAVTVGGLLPQPPGPAISFAPVGNYVAGYTKFPTPPCSGFSPCFSYPTPLAIASVFTSHVNPLAGEQPELAPLYRLSRVCTGATCRDVNHLYVTDQSEIPGWQVAGYVIDGIEGYVFPRSMSQPTGTVKLCRKFDATRDDFVLFPGAGAGGTECSATSNAYTNGGTYTSVNYVSHTNYIGWVYPVSAPTAICAGATPCVSTPGFVTAVSRRTHGAAGNFDLPLSLVPLNPTTERRQGPTAAIVITFDTLINTLTTSGITEGVATINSITISGSTITVNLTGVADQQYVTLAISGVSSLSGGTGGSASVRVGFLAGDANGSRIVSVGDVALVNAVLGQALSTANYFYDVNVSGALTTADKALVNSWLTHALPSP